VLYSGKRKAAVCFRSAAAGFFRPEKLHDAPAFCFLFSAFGFLLLANMKVTPEKYFFALAI